MSVNTTEEAPDPCTTELSEVIKHLHGRVMMEVSVTDPESGEKQKVCLVDVDSNASIDVSFLSDGEELSAYTFSFTEETHRKNEMSRADKVRRQQHFDDLSKVLGEELRGYELTAEDYFSDDSIDFSELPPEEQVKVMVIDLGHIRDDLNEIRATYTPEKKRGFISRLISRK